MTAAPLHTRLIPARDLASLEPAWLSLWEAGPSSVPFAHPAWYAAWLRHHDAPGASFLAFEDGHSLAGVVPLAIDGPSAAGLGNHKIQDYAGIQVGGGRETAVAVSLLAWADGAGLTTLRLWGLQEDAALPGALAAAVTGGWAATVEDEAVAPVADLGDSWETFVAGLPKKDRHELRRKLRNLEAAGDVRLETLSDPAAVGASLGTLFEMMRSSHEGKTRFLTGQMETFFRDMAPAMAAAGPGRAWRLLLDGRVIAVLLGFDVAGTRFLYNSGYDPAFSGLAAGLLSKAHAMQAAVEAGLHRFDFLRGEEEYKRRLGGQARRIVTVVLGRPAGA